MGKYTKECLDCRFWDNLLEPIAMKGTMIASRAVNSSLTIFVWIVMNRRVVACAENVAKNSAELFPET